MQALELSGLEQRALDLRKQIGRHSEGIANLLAERGEKLAPIDSADAEARTAIEASYGANICRIEDARAHAESDLADTEAAIERQRKEPERTRRSAEKERIAALLARHAKGAIDVQDYAERLKLAIEELHATEKELGEFAMMERAPNALQAAGLIYRLESVAWPLRHWLKVPGGQFSPPISYHSVNVPFDVRSQRVLVDLGFIDGNGKSVS